MISISVQFCRHYYPYSDHYGLVTRCNICSAAYLPGPTIVAHASWVVVLPATKCFCWAHLHSSSLQDLIVAHPSWICILKDAVSNKSINLEKNNNKHIYSPMCSIWSLVSPKNPNKNPSGEYFSGYQLYFLWDKMLKLFKILCFFGHTFVTTKIFFAVFFKLFLGLNDMILCI